jgi:hypothetical protein
MIKGYILLKHVKIWIFFLNEKLMYVALDEQNTYFNIYFLVYNYFLVVFKLVFPCFSIIYSAKKIPTAIAIDI